MADGASEDDMDSDRGEFVERDDGQEGFEAELELQEDMKKAWGAAFEDKDSRVPPLVRKYAGPLFCVAVMLILRSGGAGNSLSMSAFQHNYSWLRAEAMLRPLAAAMAYVGIYFCVITFTLPGATMLTISAGAIFPQPLAFVLAVSSATLGACGCFLMTQLMFAPALCDIFHLDRSEEEKEGHEGGGSTDGSSSSNSNEKLAELLGSPSTSTPSGPAQKRRWRKVRHSVPKSSKKKKKDPLEVAREWLDVDSFSSLVLSLTFLRIVPVMPFFVVNMAAALLSIPLKTFTVSTMLGCVPGSLLYTNAGKLLGGLLVQQAVGAKHFFNEDGSELGPMDFVWASLMKPQMWFSLAFCIVWLVVIVYLKRDKLGQLRGGKRLVRWLKWARAATSSAVAHLAKAAKRKIGGGAAKAAVPSTTTTVANGMAATPRIPSKSSAKKRSASARRRGRTTTKKKNKAAAAAATTTTKKKDTPVVRRRSRTRSPHKK